MTDIKVIAHNKKASHDYLIIDRYEAGIALTGTEVKSVRAGGVNLSDGWVDVDGFDVFLREAHIAPYRFGNISNHPEKQPRRLLLKRSEIGRISRALAQKGLTLLPLKLYFKGRWLKLEIGTAKGKKDFDKRASLKEREDHREIQRSLKKRTRDT